MLLKNLNVEKYFLSLVRKFIIKMLVIIKLIFRINIKYNRNLFLKLNVLILKFMRIYVNISFI